MKEIWKEIVGYEGLYLISNLSKIKSLPRNGTSSTAKILSPSIHARGYTKYSLHKDNKAKTFLIHRLVAETFLKNSNNYAYVCHKDGNPLNNNVENLYWGTAEMNAADKKIHGTWQGGENNPRAKLGEKDVLKIRKLNTEGIPRKFIANMFNVNVEAIFKIIKRITWKHI